MSGSSASADAAGAYDGEVKGRTVSMAILDPDVRHARGDEAFVGLEPARLIDRESRVAPAAQVRRSTFRRLVAADVVGLVIAALSGPLLLSAISSNPQSSASSGGQAYLFDLAMIPLFIGVFAVYGLYRTALRRVSKSVFADLRNIVHGLMIGGFLVAVVAYVLEKDFGLDMLSVAKITSMCLVAAVIVPVARAAAFGILGAKSQGSLPVIVVGTGKLAQTVASHLRAHAYVNFVGFVDDNPVDHRDVLGELDELPLLVRQFNVARVVVCFSRTHPERTIEMLKSMAGEVGVSIVPRYYELITSRSHVEDLSGLPMLDIAPASLSTGSRALKRSFDLVVSSIVLLVTAPAWIVVAALIKASSPGTVFFHQTRTGRNEQPFAMLKFRTMYRDAEERRHEIEHLNQVDGPLFKVRDDPRVTRIGRFLRRTSLDEFPQLINVWKGDMSLVGPRPFVVSEAMQIDGWARKRFEARPGMTGLWQVSGRNELSHLELCRLDYLYVASWSFWWDMQILWQTPTTVFRGRGAS